MSRCSQAPHGANSSSRRRTGRRTVGAAAPAAVVLAALAATAVLPGPAVAAKAKKRTAPRKATVTLTVPSTTQKTLLSKKRLTVKVKASGKATVVVRAATGKTTIAGKRTVRFTKKGTKSVALTLTATGRKTLTSCSKRTVAVTVTGGRKTVKRSRTIAGNTALCPSTKPTTPTTTSPTKPTPATTCDPASADPVDQHRCLLPWPNDYYTTADPSTPTGRRLALQPNQMLMNRGGTVVSPTPYNRSDGFSGNSALLTYIAGVDTNEALQSSGAATIGNIGRSVASDAPILVLDADTGERQPIWSEVDMSAKDPAHRLLITRAAKVFEENHHYLVVVRDLKRSDGQPAAASGWFKQIRDRTVPADAPAAVKARAATLEPVLQKIAGYGISRESLIVAWDFTTASQQSLSGPALKMRDEAFADLGDTDLTDFVPQGSSPQVTVTTVENYSHSDSHYVLRRVDGTIKVPCFMTSTAFDGKDVGPCGPGTVMRYGPDGLPVRATDASGTPLFFDAPFTCIVPRAGKDSDQMATDKRAVMFGHGLLGDATSLTSVKGRAGVDTAVICGTDWIGMANKDIPTVLQALLNMNNFPSIAERSTQSLIDFLYLGRWMISQAAGGLNDTPAFQPGGGGKLVDASEKLYNLGGSQGGIMGGALTALAPDFERSLLDVPAIGYSTLLNRSFAGSIFVPAFQTGYPDPETGQIMLSLVQTIWDRGEGGGYVHHLTTNTLPNTPAHKVLILEAFGDHLVTNIQTETEARTVGAVLRTPSLDPGRSLDTVPYWGLSTEPAASFAGPGGYDAPAVIVPIDIGPMRQLPGGQWRGVAPEPQQNTWPVEGFGPGQQGTDPHADVATSDLVLTLLRDFLRPTGGVVTDQPFDAETNLGGCGLAPCYAEGWTGPTP
jgi:hypothetical protein